MEKEIPETSKKELSPVLEVKTPIILKK